jgi:small GTP-binding protein
MNAAPRRCDYTAKTVTIGDSGAGKTSIRVRFCRQVFEEAFTPTCGVEFMSKVVEYDARRIELQLWDTAGQEAYRSVTRGYYQNATAAFFVYDVTHRESFEHVERWRREVIDVIGAGFIAILLANKTDLEDIRTVTTEEGADLARKYNMAFFEVSAKSGQNVTEAMDACVQTVSKWIQEGKTKGIQTDHFILTGGDEETQSGCG